MDFLGVIMQKVAELGVDETARLLNIKAGYVKRYIEKNGKPGYEICQRVCELWMQGDQKKVEPKDPWIGRDLCWLMPAYKSVHPKVHLVSFHLWDKTKMRLEMKANDAMIARSRNQLTKRFLKTECQWSIWWDDDVIPPFGPMTTEENYEARRAGAAALFNRYTGKNMPEKFAGVNPFERMVSWGKTIVGGTYTDRHGKGSIMVGYASPINMKPPFDTLAPVKFCGTGFLMVHRKVYEDIAAKFPEVMTEKNVGNECGFFTPIQTELRMMGEDEAFGWRANEAGHPTFLDLGVVCGHVGETIFTP